MQKRYVWNRWVWPDELSALDVVASTLAWTARVNKPQHYPLPWPHNDFTLTSTKLNHDRSAFIESLVRQGFKVVWCCATNDQVVDVLSRVRQRGLQAERFVSRARNLTESLSALGIERFNVARYEPSNPYDTAALDEATTIRNLRSALDAAGLHDIKAESFFEQEHDLFIAPPLNGAKHDVMVFTHSAFLARLTNVKYAWWQRLDLAKTMRWAESTRGWSYLEGDPLDRVIAVIDEPAEREFDRERLGADGVMVPRPENLIFGREDQFRLRCRQHLGGLGPKLVVLTEKRRVSDLVYETLWPKPITVVVKQKRLRYLPTIDLWMKDEKVARK